MPADLKTHWLFLCSQLFLRSHQEHPAEWGTLYDDLIARYREPHRVYHGVNHLQECFDTLARVPDEYLPPDREELGLALFAHDAVYELGSDCNELQSANYGSVLARVLSDEQTLDLHVWLAVVDSAHKDVAVTHTGALLCDIDLAHFGEEWESFVAKRELVAREYAPLAATAGMDASTFAKARASALKPFVERASIYQTPWFQERYERSARENLERHIAELEKA